MKLSYYILICCFLGLIGCSKEDQATCVCYSERETTGSLEDSYSWVQFMKMEQNDECLDSSYFVEVNTRQGIRYETITRCKLD